MQELLRVGVGARTAVAVVTERIDGDMNLQRVDLDTLQRRQRRLTGATWVMIDEVHGTDVVDLDRLPAGNGSPAGVGDVLVADRGTDRLAVWAADCAPVALFGANGTSRVVAHCGWRGLAAGVLDVAVDALESKGTTVAAAVLGPCIQCCCYEFGDLERRAVARGVGAPPELITGRTAWGTTALDVPAAVVAGLARRRVTLDVVGSCTGCDQRFHSHRRRAQPQRHALVAWFEETS